MESIRTMQDVHRHRPNRRRRQAAVPEYERILRQSKSRRPDSKKANRAGRGEKVDRRKRRVGLDPLFAPLSWGAGAGFEYNVRSIGSGRSRFPKSRQCKVRSPAHEISNTTDRTAWKLFTH